MSVSKLWRLFASLAFVGAGYIGCTCTPPPNNTPPSGGTCINPAQEPIKWAFVDRTCGCAPGDAKCGYEARMMRCFKSAEVPQFDCANLPPIHRAKDDLGNSWEVLDLESLRLQRETGLRLRDCMQKLNDDPANNVCPTGSSGKTPVAGHFLNRCESAAPMAAPRSASFGPDGGGQLPHECGGNDCLLPSNVWHECGGNDCCGPETQPQTK
ncbi:hypothetical protein [Pendulispora albinea]|uniref:Secreted protein n=1 Tax=Pendulispora albinea TaxID=2741071 RepID=A0ABZ2LZ15_9BACT